MMINGFLIFQNFSTPSKEILTTTLITKHPVITEFFPGLQFRTKLLGLAVPERDLIIEFDIYTQLKDRLEIRTKGIAFRQQLKLYTSMSKLFQISGDEERIGNATKTIFMFKKLWINPDEIVEYPPEVFTQFEDPFDPLVMIE
uniref:Reverse transcriptase n=1 Tax=Solanum tuberosum TaxID=4113 RepID=M1DLA8_SOLTU